MKAVGKSKDKAAYVCQNAGKENDVDIYALLVFIAGCMTSLNVVISPKPRVQTQKTITNPLTTYQI